MNKKSSSLHRNNEAFLGYDEPLNGLERDTMNDPLNNMYNVMKQDELFSIQKEGHFFDEFRRKSSPVMELPSFQEKLRSMRTNSYNMSHSSETNTTADDASTRSLDRIFSNQESKLFHEFHHRCAPAKELPRYFREKLPIRTFSGQSSIGKTTEEDSTASVIDSVLAIVDSDGYSIDSDDEESSDYDIDEEIIVPMKTGSHDSWKLSRLARGNKERSELLLDNVWALGLGKKSPSEDDELSVGDEESIDEDNDIDSDEYDDDGENDLCRSKYFL